ncbi:paraneoplastic antigen Ma3 homolog [Poeciliopsis prolifica]|uniref:paraneoplastic antigen Ma3 homolog n=1 Tax=Poeciliopsis prolifica TaxID=188132 RepID=UPI002413FBCE|nr:paraneoplastic antigen Ma3 homolog [Poeciliopsis prolifica]
MSQIGQHLHAAGADDNFGGDAGIRDDDDDDDDYDDDDDDEEGGTKVKEEEDTFIARQPVQTGLRSGSLSSLPPAHSSAEQGARPRRRKPEPASRLTLSTNDLNPPQIQRVVVEHVVRNADLTGSTSLRLRTFSGRLPKPSNEADFESWRSQIESLLADPSFPALHITRKITESLSSPAADLVKGLSPNTLPAILLNILDSAFGTVQDGEELYAQYLNILQNPGERPSSYLQRLLLTLNTVVKQGGISPADINKHLLKQFCRGCWDNTVITKLQLEQKKDNPPSFSDLLLLLRTEEDRQYAKESLMKKHMGTSKQKVHIQSQSACPCGHSAPNEELKEMKKELQKLQQQMSQLLSKKSSTEFKSMPTQKKSYSSSPQSKTKPKPWYCFNCGEDGHLSSSCTSKANPSLVEQKKKLLRQKQQAWDEKNSKSLN